MGYFNQIRESDTLSTAIKRKVKQGSISNKTREKINQKVISSLSSDAPLTERIDQVFKGLNQLGKQEGVVSQEIKDILLANVISLCVSEVSRHLKANIMPGESLNLTDRMLMPKLIELMAKKKNIKSIKYFDSLNSLFAFIKNSVYSGSIVVRMTFYDYDDKNLHFACASLDVDKDSVKLIFLDSAMIQEDLGLIIETSREIFNGLTGDPKTDRTKREAAMQAIETGVAYGAVALHYHIKKFLKASNCKVTSDKLVVKFCETGLQKSYYDCAMYSLNMATRIARTPEGEFLDKLTTPVNGSPTEVDGVIYLYDYSLEGILNKEEKGEVILPAALRKHAQSLKALQISADNIYNLEKREETLYSRVQNKGFAIQRKGKKKSSKMMGVSISIEKKREVYYNMLFVSLTK